MYKFSKDLKTIYVLVTI